MKYKQKQLLKVTALMYCDGWFFLLKLNSLNVNMALTCYDTVCLVFFKQHV